MKRSTIAILGLSAVLIATNVFWLYKMVDAGISYTYLQTSYEDARGTALQAMALLPEVASQSTTRQAAIDAVQRVQPEAMPFDKDGFVWVGDDHQKSKCPRKYTEHLQGLPVGIFCTPFFTVLYTNVNG